MTFRREVEPRRRFEGMALSRAMAGIGMNFAVEPLLDLPIEDVLFFAAYEGIEKEDFRVLGILCKWLSLHSGAVNVDRLTRLVLSCTEAERTRAFWTAVGQWRGRNDSRFARLARAWPSDTPIDLMGEGTSFWVNKHGEHSWFANTSIRVAANTLQSRESDVASPAELAKSHRTYRERVTQGPSYRADMWAALSELPDLTATELARRTYSSIGAAWSVRRDWDILHS